jgi:hypothetical protein
MLRSGLQIGDEEAGLLLLGKITGGRVAGGELGKKGNPEMCFGYWYCRSYSGNNEYNYVCHRSGQCREAWKIALLKAFCNHLRIKHHKAGMGHNHLWIT